MTEAFRLLPHPLLAVLAGVCLTAWPGSLAAGQLTDGPGAREETPTDFGRDILPILSNHCFQCHGPDAKARRGDLRLDTRDGALRADRPVIVAGSSADSELVRRITSKDPAQVMPPPKAKRGLTPAQVATLRRWVDEGASWGTHWAFEKLHRPLPPGTRDTGWARNPLDRFIRARLEREGLRPSPEADRATLLRRVTLDLTGLPPTPEEARAFLNDPSPDAYEKVVDRLLASPQYGERMAWEWLEAARYADSNGYQGDGERTMWPWRDWVVEAFNRNVPFDQLTVWQLAGDLLPGATLEQKLATGFCRNHMINGEGGRIAAENRVDYVMDMAETTATVWLGLTFNCCRCHDHKFDPFTQKDYYQLFAFFNSTPVDGGGGNPQTPPVIAVPIPEIERRLEALTARAQEAARRVEAHEKEAVRREGTQKKLPGEVLKALLVPPGSRDSKQLEVLEKHWKGRDDAHVRLLAELRGALDAREAARKSIPRVMVMEDLPRPRDTFVLDRGLYDKPGARVGIDVPARLPPLPAGAPRNRLALARWLVSPENPLTARVTVNRLWQQVFGTGLVKTAEDLGVQGEKPSHPELLDWLAAELIAGGWDLKAMYRLILTSATYRQSSRSTPELSGRDPHNRLLARGPRFRMPAWMIRDQALAASGLLVRTIGGPPVNPYQPPGVWEETTFGRKTYRQDTGAALYRRSVYTFWRRIIGPTVFFDSAPRQTCVVKPTRTNTPLHALTTLNDVTYVEASQALAQRVLLSAGSTSGRLALAFRLVLTREPGAEEGQVLEASLRRLRGELKGDPEAVRKLLAVGESPRDETLDAVEHAAWTVVCGILLNTDEALTKE